MIAPVTALFWGAGAKPRPGVQGWRATLAARRAGERQSPHRRDSMRLRRQPIIIIRRGYLEPKRTIQAERRVVFGLDLEVDWLRALGDEIGDCAGQNLLAIAAAAPFGTHHKAIDIGISAQVLNIE